MSAAPILTLMKDGESLKALPVEGEILLGRGEDCVIRLEDRAISRRHALFKRTESGVQVEKKSDFAPLLVNGSDCTSAVLKEGDVIAIGPYLLRLSQPAPERPAPAAVVPAPAVNSVGDLGPSEPAPAPKEQATAAVEATPAGLEMPLGEPDLGELENADPLEQPAENLGSDPNPPGLEPAEISVQIELAEESAATRLLDASKRVVRLLLEPGAANVTELEISPDREEIVIGRGKSCDIVLNDKKSSRRHSSIKREGQGFRIKDLGSANGTYVNGTKIPDEGILLAGDEVLGVGDAQIQFKVLSADYLRKEEEFKNLPPAPEAPEEAPAESGMPGDFVADAGIPAVSEAASGSDPGASANPAIVGMGMSDSSRLISRGISLGSNIPGINAPQKQTLMQRYILNFGKLKPLQKVMVVLVVGYLAYFLFIEEDTPAPEPAKAKAKSAQSAAAGATQAGAPGAAGSPQAAPSSGPNLSFDSLRAEQKRFVETQHELAFDLFKKGDYDKALFEIRKIFQLVSDYKNSREIERYAEDGKKKQDAIREENARKEQEARNRAKVEGLVNEAKARMLKKEYAQAREIFSEVLALDPENPQIAAFKREIENFEEQRRLEEQKAQVRREVFLQAKDQLNRAMALRKNGRCRAAIPEFGKVIELQVAQGGLITKAKQGISECKAEIVQKRDPLLTEAKAAEQGGDLAKAYQLYKKAVVVDPDFPDGYDGMDRIRGTLREKAKAFYTEAVLAESYSDFATAKQKFRECLRVAPEDDIYYERAKRKLANYFSQKEEGSDAGGAEGGAP